MTQLVLRLESESGPVTCRQCGGQYHSGSTFQVCHGETREPLCRACGKREAPALAALVELAETAGHVGRIGRHTVTPPLTALLELARAAEKYAESLARSQAA